MIYSKKYQYISVCYVSSVSMCVCVDVLLVSSRPHHVTNSMKEVIIGRSSALPGGTTCIWMQAFALSQDLSCILYLYHSFPHFILCFSLTFSPSVSHALSHYVYSAVSVINMMRLSFYFSKIPHSFSFQCFFFLWESSTVYLLQYSSGPPLPPPTQF